jgi:ribosome biogenesis GTPase A
MGINWYPGHMVKARREIQNNIKLVDITIILLDARAPFSCRNRDLENLTSRKKTIMVLNKADLAPKETVRRYLDILRKEGHAAVSFDSITGKGVQKVVQSIRAVYQEISAEMVRKGRRVRPARIMVMGVPNVGKSTFLNCLVGKKMAATGARPGVTRGTQWIRVREDMEFMDTPGLMWPRIDEPEQGAKTCSPGYCGRKCISGRGCCPLSGTGTKRKSP